MTKIKVQYIASDNYTSGKVVEPAKLDLPSVEKMPEGLRELYDETHGKLVDQGRLYEAKRLFRVFLMLPSLDAYLGEPRRAPLFTARLDEDTLMAVLIVYSEAMLLNSFEVDGADGTLTPASPVDDEVAFVDYEGKRYRLAEIHANLILRSASFLDGSKGILSKAQYSVEGRLALLLTLENMVRRVIGSLDGEPIA